MYLPGTCTLAEVAVAIDDPERAAIVRRSLEPYAERIATSGLAGISIGPVSHYVGLAAEASGDLAAAADFQRAAIERNRRDGTRPHEARAHFALGRVLRALGDDEAAATELATATAMATEIGLVLDA